MTLGIAIPCHSNHVEYLNRLLNSISKSTILPNQVSISISSFDGEINLDDYNFEIIISKTIDHKNACQNRDIAGSELTTDIITFIDADDFSHFKRNEYILKSFDMGADIVVHDYFLTKSDKCEFCVTDIGDFKFSYNYIDTNFPECHFPSNKSEHKGYACGHPSIKNEIFKNLKFSEDNDCSYSGEDGRYLKKLISHGYKISHIENKLTQYNN
jgi:hypothetical protein